MQTLLEKAKLGLEFVKTHQVKFLLGTACLVAVCVLKLCAL